MASTYATGGDWAVPHEIRRRMRHVAGSVLRAMAAGRRHEGPGPQHRGPHQHGPHQCGPHEHRGRRGGPFPGGPFPWDFGRGGPFGGGPFGRGRKAKRGDVRAAILALLSEEPRNGYQIIQEIAQRSHGGWKPSPGAVYPALQQLTDEGMVLPEESDGRKTFRLTETGRSYVAEHPDEVRAPWEEMTPDMGDGAWELMDLGRQSAVALFQVLQTGSEAQIRQAGQIMIETRRRLYRILADGDPGEE